MASKPKIVYPDWYKEWKDSMFVIRTDQGGYYGRDKVTKNRILTATLEEADEFRVRRDAQVIVTSILKTCEGLVLSKKDAKILEDGKGMI